MNNDSFIINAFRTPIGSFGGELSSLSAPQLGSKVIEHIIKMTNIDVKNYNEVIMGNVLSAGLGQAPARQAAILGGLPNLSLIHI